MPLSISFLRDDSRVKIPCVKGKFPVRHPKSSPRGRSSYITRNHTANEIVNLPQVKDRDPVLTFEDGTKMRVYRGGCSTDLLSEAAGRIDKHDEMFQVKPRIRKKEQTTAPMRSEEPVSWEDFMGDDSW